MIPANTSWYLKNTERVEVDFGFIGQVMDLSVFYGYRYGKILEVSQKSPLSMMGRSRTIGDCFAPPLTLRGDSECGKGIVSPHLVGTLAEGFLLCLKSQLLEAK